MIFGTDGLRARMDSYPLTREIIEKLSQVLKAWLPDGAEVVLGHDSRRSCATIRDWITSAMDGLRVWDLGLVPTPAVAFETRARGAQLGIMITASHNPAHDNGLKFFDGEGLKIRYDQAKAWSDAVLALDPRQCEGSADLVRTQPTHYRSFLEETFGDTDFSQTPVAFDLANGAGSELVPPLLKALGIKAQILGATPDGDNINAGIGALHPETLHRTVVASGYLAGFALDGDGDRLIVVDRDGPLHGDLVLYALRKVMVAEGADIDTVVGTIMCGKGLEQSWASQGVALKRTPVGDQNVLAKLIEDDLLLGGEPSGHLLQCDLFPAGDGVLGALRLLRALTRTPDLLARARAEVPMYPVFENAYPVRHKPKLLTQPKTWSAMERLDAALADQGRLIVRYSGTEPKLRVFLEAPDLAPFKAGLAQLESAIAEELA
ncbi:hypothetical protein SCOR_02910 [Sulfidibacter corallicola]|uniref:Phosphoglucosamine mutase n=1 Tax=Sulfidibacter corallicola TaxID=2818388 RepID=A0A8A4TI66_SULCO|nr:hypothetical protein [Sulfidibacter corallicola]QTD48521.1 hypothetical protein J3U87_23320 [Sulfidibacter corallicola]